jgi:hypothetical protein
MTQRFVPGVGKLAIVNGLLSGPITYCVLGRRDSITNALMHLTEQLRVMLCTAPLKFSYDLENPCDPRRLQSTHQGHMIMHDAVPRPMKPMPSVVNDGTL